MTGNQRQTRYRVVVFSPHFSEYSIRLSLALAAHADVLLIVDANNRSNECTETLMDLAKKSIRILEYRYSSRWSRLYTLLSVLVNIAAFRPHVFHVQEQADRSTARIVDIVAKFVFTAVTVHDPLPHAGRDFQAAQDQSDSRAKIRRAAELFHVHGGACQRQLVAREGAGKPIVSTMHGVILCPEPLELKKPTDGRFLFFGRMEAYKGLTTLLEAVNILEKREVMFRLVLAGRGPELDRLAESIKTSERIELIDGYLTPAEATNQFQRACFIVAPYHDATQSGVVAAAYGAGRPLVATSVGGLVDSVIDGETGILVPPGDAGALADAIQAALCDGDLLHQLTLGAEAARDGRHAWSAIALALLAAYDLVALK